MPSSKACAPSERGEFLKAEGNELHQKGNFQAAYQKYTQAIKEDPKNAIYYANRAASSLALKQYVLACIFSALSLVHAGPMLTM